MDPDGCSGFGVKAAGKGKFVISQTPARFGGPPTKNAAEGAAALCLAVEGRVSDRGGFILILGFDALAE